jgi:AmmeMemoRadiSam system protein B
MLRTPAVANMFYPGKEGPLRHQVDAFIKVVPEPKRALAAVCPHAGYMYSGGVAGAVFSQIQIPDSVVILGPNHRGLGAHVAVDTSDGWQMPMGTVPINEGLARLIIDRGGDRIEGDSQAHAMEHSIEVQVPFLQLLRPDLTIVPICVSHVSFGDCEKIGQALAAVIRDYGRDVLLVASTDMTHYESQKAAKAKDRLAIDRILDLDPKGLYEVVAEEGISMCGVVPTAIVLTACNTLGATKAELVRYATSGDVTGDFGQVVGYAGFVVS